MVIVVLDAATGGVLAIQGYSLLGNIGIEALHRFLSAFINVRIAAPVVAGIDWPRRSVPCAGLRSPGDAHQRGDRTRWSRWRPLVEYLVSTRIVAGMIAITPLYAIAVILPFLASQFTTVVLLWQSGGSYDHYFDTFLNPIDLLWSFLQAVLMAITILVIHTYFGYLPWWPIRSRGGGRQRRVHRSSSWVFGDTARVAVGLRLQRKLQPEWLAGVEVTVTRAHIGLAQPTGPKPRPRRYSSRRVLAAASVRTQARRRRPGNRGRGSG